MPNVMLTVTGKAVGAAGEDEAFAEMARVAVAGVAEHARTKVQVGADDAVRIEVVVDKSLQSDVGEALAHLVVHPEIQSAVIDA
jgi:citrate lyase gamma subunit